MWVGFGGFSKVVTTFSHVGGSFIFYGHHWVYLNNPFFFNLGLCTACWARFMCHHEMWPTSVTHPFLSIDLYALLEENITTQIANFMGPTRGPPGSCRPQMGPMLAPWILLSEQPLLGTLYPGTPLLNVVNSLRPRRNGRYNADDIFKCIFLKENVWIPTKISLKFVPKGPINNIPALVQIMAWRRPGDKPLSEPMMVSLLTYICVTRPQWFKSLQLIWRSGTHRLNLQMPEFQMSFSYLTWR